MNGTFRLRFNPNNRNLWEKAALLRIAAMALIARSASSLMRKAHVVFRRTGAESNHDCAGCEHHSLLQRRLAAGQAGVPPSGAR